MREKKRVALLLKEKKIKPSVSRAYIVSVRAVSERGSLLESDSGKASSEEWERRGLASTAVSVRVFLKKPILSRSRVSSDLETIWIVFSRAASRPLCVLKGLSISSQDATAP